METVEEKAKTLGGDRRSFLRNAGVGAVAAALIMSSCKKKKDDPAPVVTNPPAPDNSGVDLGSGDVGILNYAYALEQLEAAFYTTVVTDVAFTTTFPQAAEQSLLKDIAAHEVIHREYLKAALAKSAIPGLDVDFSSINFKDRKIVLEKAMEFEDLGVSAYNGAGHSLVNVNYLLAAGKIVSVEARHASAIRDLLKPGTASFAGDDIVDPASGLDKSRTPSEVFAIAGKYIKTKLNASNLPA